MQEKYSEGQQQMRNGSVMIPILPVSIYQQIIHTYDPHLFLLTSQEIQALRAAAREGCVIEVPVLRHTSEEKYVSYPKPRK